MGFLLCLLGLIAYDKAETYSYKKKADAVCREKGWGNYKYPDSNEFLQQRYYTSYVIVKLRFHEYIPKTADELYQYDADISCWRDPVTNKILLDDDGNVIPTTKRERIEMAKADFRSKGYYWDTRYDPDEGDTLDRGM